MNISLKKNEYHVHNLECELLDLLRKKFNFYTQLKFGQLKQTHLLKQMRREVARMKFYLSQNSCRKRKGE